MNKTKRTIILTGLSFALVSVIIALVFVFSTGGASSAMALPNGITYEYASDESGDTAKMGEVVLLHYNVYTAADSLLLSTRDMSADPIPRLVSEPQYYGDLSQLYSKLSKGDSMIIHIPMDSLQFNDKKPSWFEAGKSLRVNMKCFDISTVEAYEAQMKIKDSLNMIEESKSIESYLTDHKLAFVKTSSGVFVSVTSKGSGAAITQGKSVTLNYTGKLLTDGTIFDSSLNPGREPMNYQYGVQQMIPGFTDAIGILHEGDKATFIIPSMLAYGPQEQGPIPANSILLFEVEILKVK